MVPFLGKKAGFYPDAGFLDETWVIGKNRRSKMPIAAFLEGAAMVDTCGINV